MLGPLLIPNPLGCCCWSSPSRSGPGTRRTDGSRASGWRWSAAAAAVKGALSRHIRMTSKRCTDVTKAAGRRYGQPLARRG